MFEAQDGKKWCIGAEHSPALRTNSHLNQLRDKNLPDFLKISNPSPASHGNTLSTQGTSLHVLSQWPLLAPWLTPLLINHLSTWEQSGAAHAHSYAFCSLPPWSEWHPEHRDGWDPSCLTRRQLGQFLALSCELAAGGGRDRKISLSDEKLLFWTWHVVGSNPTLWPVTSTGHDVSEHFPASFI